MFIDARQLPDKSEIDCDVCIVGAGAAGLTIASELIGSGLDVAVIESGGISYDRTAQSLYQGTNTGLLYEPLDLCRVRTFGGSTDRRGWGGWVKALSPMDFEERSWVPLSGWPISRDDLEPYYARAFSTLSLPGDTPEQAKLDAAKSDVLPVAGPDACNEPCALSPRPHLAEVMTDEIKAARNVRVFTHANALEFRTDKSGAQVTQVDLATLGKTKFHIKARQFVMAAGGLENARLLLLSDRQRADGLGNDSGYVGRCFMEHPRFAWGQVKGDNIAPLVRRYDPGTIVGMRSSGQLEAGSEILFGASLALTEKAQRDHEILGARTWILPVSRTGDTDGGREIKELVFWLKKKRIPSDVARRIRHVLSDLPNAARAVGAHLSAKMSPPTAWQFVTVLEQEPFPDSRVTLDPCETDPLGQRRIRLDWQLGPLTKRTLQKTREIFCNELTQAGFDCAIEGPAGSQTNQEHDAPRWVWHHMGTTRMSADPASGVVDANCRVHGVSNLFIAGSSVFPTGGNDMPTTTVIALAHRLADHLKVVAKTQDRVLAEVEG